MEYGEKNVLFTQFYLLIINLFIRGRQTAPSPGSFALWTGKFFKKYPDFKYQSDVRDTLVICCRGDRIISYLSFILFSKCSFFIITL